MTTKEKSKLGGLLGGGDCTGRVLPKGVPFFYLPNGHFI